jgi:hypothetical protein
MFELSVSTSFQNQKYIAELYKKLYEEIKIDSGIAIRQNCYGRSFFSFAVPEEKKEYYKSKILEYIVFMIIDDYKFNFYKSNLKLEYNDIIIEPFLKAISIFDADIDREYICSRIDFSGEILVDSFYYFKLQELRQRWAKTADIINQNQILNSNSSMTEILKYLADISENLVLCADVFIGKKQLKINNFALSKCFKRDEGGCSKFLSELVRLNPSKIRLKISTDENDELFLVMSKIFDDKIYVLT